MCLTSRVVDLLSGTDPISVSLDQVKAEQILSLTDNVLQLVCSQTPVIKRLIKSCQSTRYSIAVISPVQIIYHVVENVVSPDSSEVRLDPDTAHPKLIISPRGDSVTYTDAWQEVPDLPGRFDTTLNVVSLQGYGVGLHYWEMDVTGKTYWEIGVTYRDIPRKGAAEDCWLGRGDESWCVEFFDGEYTAWHGGVPHQLPFTRRLCRVGVLCNFPAGLVTFIEAASMTPLYCYCVGTFSRCLHLALCPGHKHNGSNSKPIVICDPPSPTGDLGLSAQKESF